MLGSPRGAPALRLTEPRPPCTLPMTATLPKSSEARQTGLWMALLAAFLGWMFDGFEIGLFPLVARPALIELLGSEGFRSKVERGDAGSWIVYFWRDVA